MSKLVLLLLLILASVLVISCGSDNQAKQDMDKETAGDVVDSTAAAGVANSATTAEAVEPTTTKKEVKPATTKKEVKPAVTKKEVKPATIVIIPDSTAITVKLADSIDTDINVSGDIFYATLSQAIIADGHTLCASGAKARGVLDSVVESGRMKTPAELTFSLTAIQDKDGNWIEVGTVPIVDKKDSHTKREVAMIGGGAVVGGIIGKIVNKKGSTEIGAAAGAVAGTGLSAVTGKQDIFYGAGTEVVFFSNKPLPVTLK